MAERRSLIDGIKPPPPVDPALEKKFVYGTKQAPEAEPIAQPMARAPISTRIRSDYAQALKKASLQRQLAGTQPNTLQEILEEALEPWLKSNGYVS